MLKRNLSLIIGAALLWLFLCVAAGAPIVISAPDADVDLAITKTDSVDPAVAGEALTYTLSISNAGPSTATGVTITDTLPGGLSYTSASSGCSYHSVSRTVRCDLGEVASGAATSATIRARVDPATTGSLLNQATVATLDTDTNATNNSAQATTNITSSGDLHLSMTAPASVIAGDTITYTLAISNTGPSDARGVVLRDDFPGGVSYARSSLPCSVQGHRLTCSAGVLAARSRRTETVTLSVDPGKIGTVNNDVQISGTTPDPNSANNLATLITPVVISSDLTISKRATSATAAPGALLTYMITTRNNGLSDGQGVEIRDSLPSQVAYQSYTATKGTCTGANPVTCTPGSVTPGETITITLVGRVDAAAGAGTITNTASVLSTSADPSPTNNTASESTIITAVDEIADVQISKRDLRDPIRAGQLLTYTITISNTGPAQATGVVVTDTLPVSAALRSARASQGSCTGIICSLGAIDADNRALITMTVSVYPSVTGVITNTARVTANEEDPVSGNNRVQETTTILNETADLQISKHDLSDPVRAGERLTYTLTVRNNGPAIASGVIVTDSLPAAATLAAITTSQGSCTESVCALGTIEANQNAFITLTVTVAPTATDSIMNIARVAGNEEDLVPENNTAQESTTILPGPADVQISKQDLTDPARAGESLIYVLDVNNAGPANASGIIVTDTLPSALTLQSATPSQGSCAGAVCSLGNLLVGNQATITLTAGIHPAASGVITNTAAVSASQLDPNPGNNSASERTRINRAADVGVVKTGQPDPAFAGKNLTYRLEVSNQGPSRAEGVRLVDNLPAVVSFVSAPAGCTHSNGTVECILGGMQPDASVVISITTYVDLAASGLINNTASVSSTTTDPVQANNQSIWTSTVLPPDYVLPTVSWTQPVTDTQTYHVNCQMVHLQVDATDNIAVERVLFYRWDANISAYVDIGYDTTAPYGWDLDTCVLNAKWNEIFARSQDTYGNLSIRKSIFLYRHIMLYLPVIIY